MLEKLAGPFVIKDADGNTVSIDYNAATYTDAVGFTSHSSFVGISGTFYSVAQLDGLIYRRSLHGAAERAFDFPSGELLIRANFDSELRKFDSRAGVDGDLICTGTVANVQCKLPDRYLYVINSLVKFMSFGDITTMTTEYTFSGSLGGFPKFSPTEYPDVICLVYPNGDVVFYNWRLKVEALGRMYLPANRGGWYSPKLRVIVLLDTSNQLSVYALTPRPNAISTPVAVTSLLKGKVSKIRTRVTGSNGEPCPNELVDWTMTGPGSLSATQSTTDSSGYAEVKYIAPLTLTTSPNFVATVKF